MSYRKIGGLHFIRIGRLGFSWYWSRKRKLDTGTRKLLAEMDERWPKFEMSPSMVAEFEQRLTRGLGN